MIINNSAKVQTRINPILKEAAEAVIRMNWFKVSEFLTIIYTYIAETKELPIERKVKKIPNSFTKKVLSNADIWIDLIECKDQEDFFKKLKS